MTSAEVAHQIALSLPETSHEGSGYFVRRKLFAWTYHERVAPKEPRVPRPDVLVVRVSSEGEKQMLLSADPDKFFTTAHYNGYPAILIRLPRIDIEELTELITDAWRIQAPRTLVNALDANG
jgi:hypothetical protein